MTQIENRTYDEISVGDTASLVREVSERDIQLFGALSGDINPVHFDDEYAQGTMFKGRIVHGIWSVALFSTLLGMQLPGPGTIYLGQTSQFRRPIRVGDTITATVTVATKDDDTKRVTLTCVCTNQDGTEVTLGEATVIAPSEKVSRPLATMPNVMIN